MPSTPRPTDDPGRSGQQWDCRRYGTAEDPVHKSHLLEYHRCARRFRFRRQEEGIGVPPRAFGRALAGTAAHATLERALPWAIRTGSLPELHHLRQAYFEAWYTALKAAEVDEQTVSWPRAIPNPQTFHRTKIAEVFHFIQAAPKTIGTILALEAPVSAEIPLPDGSYTMVGAIDLLFLTRDRGRLAVADYKSGGRRPTQFRLNHGLELGLYCHAIRWGKVKLAEPYPADWEVDKDGLVSLGRYPDDVYLVQLSDFLPQQKDSRRQVWMRDECRFFGVAPGSSVAIKKGKQRGPGWYRAKRDESELASLAHSVRQVIGSIRLGRFPPVLDDDCNTCAYRTPCIGESYGPSASERRRLEKALAELPDVSIEDSIL